MQTEITDLSSFKQRAVQAHNWTSFSPEKRGENLINEFEQELKGDVEELKKMGSTDETIAAYVSRFKSLFSSWISAKSNCISSMITGPSKFPTRRAEKANRSEENKYAVLQSYRERAKKAIKKSLKKEVDPLEEAMEKLTRYKANHQTYLDINKAYRAFKKKPESLEKSTLSEAEKKFIREFVPRYSYEPNPFPAYKLTNNNAEIKRLEGRVKELQAKKDLAQNETLQVQNFPFEGGELIIDYTMDRVLIRHNEKPPRETIDGLKKRAFHWSPSSKAWMRKITRDAIYTAQELVGIKN